MSGTGNAGRACAWSARDVLGTLVIVVWGVVILMRGQAYPNVSPLEWLGGLGIVLGTVSKFYSRVPPPPEQEGEKQ